MWHFECLYANESLIHFIIHIEQENLDFLQFNGLIFISNISRVIQVGR